AAADHLRPTLRAHMPDPSCFADMDRAAALLIDAVEDGRRCAVFADYDVDGATSAALLVRWFRALGRPLDVVVPDRLTEGYGPSPPAFRRLRAEGVELVVTVDCGAAAHEALEAAAGLGLPVVVVDHHLMRPGEAPPAAALVNPNRPDCASGQGGLAAAGVVFVLLVALNREARRRGLFGPRRPEPDLRRWLDLAALGAICDVVPLAGLTRALASQGLQAMGRWDNPGLAALAAAAGLAEGTAATAFHAGFLLGPRINAGGRIGRSDLGARLLSTDDAAEARALAAELDALNAERKAVEAQVTAEAERQAQAALSADPDAPVLVVAGEGWHPGVVGIVAGRLRERWRRPVLVIGVDPATGVGKGSGRSQPGVNLGRAVQSAYEAGLLLAGGGHAMAAGVTVPAGGVEPLAAFLARALAAAMREAFEEDALELDALLAPDAADRALLDAFAPLQPFGAGAPEPVFAFADMRLVRAQPLRGGHVRAEFASAEGAPLRTVAWRAGETDLGRRLLAGGGALHLAGRLRADDWKGRRGVQLEIEDAADPRRVG
ncbi:MAG: single-stranded-DNA-specific exonuclease RecJ, partial [Caulobacteraceae bacterium]|nr:single-stranded-DNA-specific exonuclease RecJ [Caulobacter sp.]